VETAEAMSEAIDRATWDIIISDYSMPHFSGGAALQLYKDKGLDIPFVIVSGTIGDEAAVASMVAGAHDYLIKNSLSRLVPAVQRELKEAESRRERLQAQDALRNHHLMLSRTERIAHIGSWEKDVATDREIWSDELFRILRRDPREGALSLAEQAPFYGPEDMARLRRAVEAAVADGTPYEVEIRVIRNDGQIRACVARGVAETAPSGRVVRLCGSLQDITDRMQVREALIASEARYRNIFENAVEGIYQSTVDGRFLVVNAALARMAGYDSPDEFKASIEDIGTDLYVHHADRSRYSELMEANGTVDGFEVNCCKKDGSTFWAVIHSRAVKDDEGKTLFYEGIVEDITLRRQAEESLHDTLSRLRKAIAATIQVMVSVVEARDPYTAGHQLRSADLARAIATEMGLPPGQIDGIRMAGSIHDIGKLSVPAELLSKPTRLSAIEFSLIKEHARCGYEILKDVESPWPLAEIVYQHHERANGTGYPRNLKGDEILLEARILAVADVVEAMASHRPYRPSLGIDAALEEIERNRGTLFEPAVVDACLALFRWKGYRLLV
jgi:PAS domain S-box-containing protein